MVKRTHLLVAVMASLVAGALVSTGVSQLAQVAYSGANPQAAQGISRNTPTIYRNSRSLEQELLHGSSAELPTPRQAATSSQGYHEAAPISDAPEECAGMSHQRRTQCLLNSLEDIIFRLRETE